MEALREFSIEGIVLAGALVLFLLELLNLPFNLLFWTGFSLTLLSFLLSVLLSSSFGKSLMLFLTSLIFLASYDYFNRKDSRYGELSYLYLITLLGLMVLLTTKNLIVAFVGLELYSISAYLLVSLLKGDYPSKEGSFKYLLIGTIGTSLFTLGIALIYGATGSFNLKRFEDYNTLLVLGISLLIFAIGLKVSAFPFHFWTPDAYEGAPTPTTSFIATVPKVGLFFFLSKLSLYLFPAVPQWKYVVGLMATLSMFYGSFVAYTQNSVKRLLAYSSVAHAGYFLVALSVVDKELIKFMLFYVFSYALATLSSFIVLSVLEKKRGWNHRIVDFSGLFKEERLLSSILALNLFALIGIPPMAIFVGKLGIFFILMDKNLTLLAVLFALASLISAGYYLKVVKVMFLDERFKSFERAPLSVGEMTTLITSSILLLVLGLFPNLVLDKIPVNF